MQLEQRDAELLVVTPPPASPTPIFIFQRLQRRGWELAVLPVVRSPLFFDPSLVLSQFQALQFAANRLCLPNPSAQEAKPLQRGTCSVP